MLKYINVLGRRANGWISQDGCLQFSLFVTNFKLRDAVFLQYLIALEVCRAIVDLLPKARKLVCVKWPNDIYLKQNNTLVKIGGIIVQSNITGHSLDCLFGIGLNLLNEKPTTSLSSALDLVDTSRLKERVLAQILFRLDASFKIFKEEGFPSFIDAYYTYWIHE